MLTPEQDAALDDRAPDVRLCPHHIQVMEMGDRSGPMMYVLQLKGHMVMEDDVPGGDGDVHVEDHRLFCVEIPMVPSVWQSMKDAVNEADEAIKNVIQEQNRNPGNSMVDPDALAAFMRGIPPMFLRNHRKDDGK